MGGVRNYTLNVSQELESKDWVVSAEVRASHVPCRSQRLGQGRQAVWPLVTSSNRTGPDKVDQQARF